MKYKISKAAAQDLEDVWLYTSLNSSVQQADRYFNLLMDEIEYVAGNPYAGKDFSHIREGYLRTQVKSHFIFYKINVEADSIEIIRILHQQMDIQARLI